MRELDGQISDVRGRSIIQLTSSLLKGYQVRQPGELERLARDKQITLIRDRRIILQPVAWGHPQLGSLIVIGRYYFQEGYLQDLGHELGHILLGHTASPAFSAPALYGTAEAEANFFKDSLLERTTDAMNREFALDLIFRTFQPPWRYTNAKTVVESYLAHRAGSRPLL